MSNIGTDKLVFDPYATLSDDSNVGAFLRSGKGGALVTHHNRIKPSAGTFNFVDADVSVLNDTVTEAAHGFYTGDKVQLTTTGVLPGGLALLTDYWVIRVDANTIKFASNEMNAEIGTAVDITSAAGGGTHTVTGQEEDLKALDVWISNPSLVVTATDLDIRDLTHVSDSIKIGDGVDFLAVNSDGSINVNADISVTTGFEKAEDSAHADGDIGGYVLSVRQDALSSSTSLDGDYQSFKTDSVGALWTRISQGNVTVSPPNTAFVADNISVSNTATQLWASALANRKSILIQNLDNKPIYIGSSGVTIADGIRIAAGGNWEIAAGDAINLYAITASGTADVRLWEIS